MALLVFAAFCLLFLTLASRPRGEGHGHSPNIHVHMQVHTDIAEHDNCVLAAVSMHQRIG